MSGPFEGVGSVERRLRLINAMEMMGLKGKKKDAGGVGGIVLKAYGLAHV